MGNFYGIDGLKMITHGTQNDPEIEYKGYRVNYYAIEDPLWQVYNEIQEGLGEPVTDKGFEEWVPTQVDEIIELIKIEVSNKMKRSFKTVVSYIEGHMALINAILNDSDVLDLIELDNETSELNELSAHFNREVFDLCMAFLEKDDL